MLLCTIIPRFYNYLKNWQFKIIYNYITFFGKIHPFSVYFVKFKYFFRNIVKGIDNITAAVEYLLYLGSELKLNLFI